MVSIAEENLIPAKFYEYSFGNAKLSPLWIVRVLKKGKFNRKTEGKLSCLILCNVVLWNRSLRILCLVKCFP